MSFRKIAAGVFVSGQVAPADMAMAKAAGIALVVNNRPDGESFDQPAGAAIRRAAEDAGLAYAEVPIGAGGFTDADVAAMAALLDRDEATLAFCRSGTRSIYLWALAEARRGGDADAILAAVEAAGYDPGPIVRPVRSPN